MKMNVITHQRIKRLYLVTKKITELNTTDKNMQKMCINKIDDKIKTNVNNNLCQNCYK